MFLPCSTFCSVSLLLLRSCDTLYLKTSAALLDYSGEMLVEEAVIRLTPASEGRE